MSELKKVNDQEMENVAGGNYGGPNIDDGWRTVCGLTGGYLAIRTAPAAAYENEINHIGLYNGEQVQIAGDYVQGTGFGGPATYVYVFAPKFGCYGYVNAAYLG